VLHLLNSGFEYWVRTDMSDSCRTLQDARKYCRTTYNEATLMTEDNDGRQATGDGHGIRLTVTANDKRQMNE